MGAFLAEILAQDFMVRALAGGALVGVACAMMGVLIVQRGITFVGDGLAHTMFGSAAMLSLVSAAAGAWWGVGPGFVPGDDDFSRFIWLALPLNVLVGLAMAWVRRTGKLRGDTVIGIFFPVMFAAGVLALALRRQADAPPVNMEALLFGSVLGMTTTDLMVTAGGAFAIALIVLTWGRRIAYAAFDPDLAAMSGVRVALAEYALFGLSAAVVAVSVRLAGVVLVSSLLAIPAGAAALWRGSYGAQLLFAALFAAASVKIGLMVSYAVDAPCGAMIVLTMGVLFTASWVLRELLSLAKGANDSTKS
jgi:zinc transport system permease protein